MKRLVLLVCAVLLASGCATTKSMRSAEFRERQYDVGKVALSPQGLTPAQIAAITATKLPTKFPVDISIMLVKDRWISEETAHRFLASMVAELQKSDKIARVVPIPEVIFPHELNFTAIQELGIRTLTEYVAIFVLDSESVFKCTKIIKSEHQTTSAVDFLLVDPQTTAIMASDKILSEVVYQQNILKSGEKAKAEAALFAEQGAAVGNLLAELFQ